MKKMLTDSSKKYWSKNTAVSGKFLNDYLYTLAY